MLTTEQWVPVDGAHELSLMHALVSQRCRLVKPLRYDARDVAVFPNALLPDVGAVPVPRHVVSAFIAPKDSAANDVAGGSLRQRRKRLRCTTPTAAIAKPMIECSQPSIGLSVSGAK